MIHGVESQKRAYNWDIADFQICFKMTWVKISWLISHGGTLRERDWLLSNSQNKRVPFKGASWLPYKFVRYSQETPDSTNFSWILLLKHRKDQKIQELYPLVLVDPRAAQKRGQNGKKVKKAENSQHLHWSKLKIIYSSNT